MKIALYIHKMIYKYGGTESFTAKFLEILQDLYPADSITLITECFKRGDELSEEQMIQRLNSAYGTAVKQNNFYVRYIAAKEPKASKNPFLRLSRKCNTVAFQKQLCKVSSEYDLFINSSNQSYLGSAKRNITVIHFPQDRSEVSGINRKLSFLRPFARVQDSKYRNCYTHFMPNSQFTAYWLKQKWQIPDEKIQVCYPPITGISKRCTKNPFQIVACGRIEASKKIHVMVEAFNSSEFLKNNCVFKIAGSCDNEDTSYIDYIRSMASENVQIILSPSRSQIEELYAESGIFWHAKGYGETNPMLMEHFGMTTVEAMSAGCIPVVINKGGQKEIVTADCGYTWDEPEQLVAYTEQLLKLPEETLTAMRNACIERSNMCSKESFKKSVKTVLDAIN